MTESKRYIVLENYKDAGHRKWRQASSLGRAVTLASNLSASQCTVTIMEHKPLELTTEQLVYERKMILEKIDAALSNELEKVLQGE